MKKIICSLVFAAFCITLYIGCSKDESDGRDNIYYQKLAGTWRYKEIYVGEGDNAQGWTSIDGYLHLYLSPTSYCDISGYGKYRRVIDEKRFEDIIIDCYDEQYTWSVEPLNDEEYDCMLILLYELNYKSYHSKKTYKYNVSFINDDSIEIFNSQKGHYRLKRYEWKGSF